MKEFKALLDIVAHTVHLESLVHGIAVLQLPSHTVTASALHNIIGPCLRDIPLVQEFLDVFPDDLPGMPLDQDVEFTIKLKPSMTPISRWPYKMTPEELAELKIQLTELLHKGYIHMSFSP
jgi:hypothetical protein